MPSVFSFDAMVIYGALSALLLIGLILRAKIGFFQRFFIPACIIAGLLGLAIRTTAVGLGWIDSGVVYLETAVYHIFNITFISLGLTTRTKEKVDGGKKSGFKDITSMGLLIVTIAALQFLIGGVFVLLFRVFNINLFSTFGFLVTMGFEEGPGQALSIGKTWETYGFTNAATIGLSFATIGFMFAIFVGVPLVGWAIKKGKVKVLKSEQFKSFKAGIFSKEKQDQIAGTHTIHPATLDSLTFHAALVGIVYVLTYGFLYLLEQVASSDVVEMFWGFFFVFGLLIAFAVRIFIEKIGAGHLLDRELQGRITGWGVDFLVVSAITAISLGVVLEYAIPIIAIAVTTGVLTLLWVFYFGQRLWKNHSFERTAGVYGMETGTVATGLMLIRIVDPEFKSPAATDLALSGVIALPVMFLMFYIMNAPILLDWDLEPTLLVFLAVLVAVLILFKVLGFMLPKDYKK